MTIGGEVKGSPGFAALHSFQEDTFTLSQGWDLFSKYHNDDSVFTKEQ